jgi:hypothetical protein
VSAIVVALVGVALGCAAFLWVAYRAERLADRVLTLRETAAARAAVVPDKLRIPPDLLAMADDQSEPWAQDQTRALLRESFEELGSWALVRAKVAP